MRYGDYDVDGITSVAIMIKALRIWEPIRYYIPNRLEEGYGLNLCSIDKIRRLERPYYHCGLE